MSKFLIANGDALALGVGYASMALWWFLTINGLMFNTANNA
jgi:hypothetical protein